MRILHLIVGASLVLPAFAGEYAVLSNGSRIHADRHEADGGTVRLIAGTSVTEFPAGLITSFEAEEFVPVPVVSAAEPKPQTLPVTDQALRSAVPQDLAAAAAHKYALPSSFVQSVMKTESAFRADALSPKGAMGLMQLMPDTARTLGVDPRNPRENAEGGAHYLHELLAKYESSPDQVLLALAAYNAGPKAVERYHGVPPYRETREYILRVLKGWDRAQSAR